MRLWIQEPTQAKSKKASETRGCAFEVDGFTLKVIMRSTPQDKMVAYKTVEPIPLSNITSDWNFHL